MNKKSPDNSVFKTKRFYVALYSCLGVLLVLAAVVSFVNLNSMRKNAGNATSELEKEQGQFEPVVKNEAESYLTPEDRGGLSWQAGAMEDGLTAAKPAATSEPKATQSPTTGTAPKTTQSPPANTTPATTSTPSSKQEELKQDASKLKPQTETPPAATEEPKKTSSDDGERTETGLAEPIFNAYDEGTKMLWPVSGDIVMDYSAERLVYDKTLDQYRTNKSISIAAATGSQVKAAADGVVKSVTRSKENGNTVVIDNGNGWLTTYSQLQDQVLVKEGDVVKTGQVIGGVNNPTIFSVLLGSHLNFSVEKDEISVDPKSVLLVS